MHSELAFVGGGGEGSSSSIDAGIMIVYGSGDAFSTCVLGGLERNKETAPLALFQFLTVH